MAQPIKVDGRLKSRFQGSLQGKEWIPGMSYPDDAEPEVESVKPPCNLITGKTRGPGDGADCRITNRLCSWLTELLDAHSPDSSPVQSPATKTSFDVTLPREPTVLAVTHTECMTALMRLFTAAHQQCKDILPCPLDMHVSEDIRARLDVPNAGFAVLRVRWEDKEGSLLPQGEVERWGVTEHLA